MSLFSLFCICCFVVQNSFKMINERKKLIKKKLYQLQARLGKLFSTVWMGNPKCQFMKTDFQQHTERSGSENGHKHFKPSTAYYNILNTGTGLVNKCWYFTYSTSRKNLNTLENNDNI